MPEDFITAAFNFRQNSDGDEAWEIEKEITRLQEQTEDDRKLLSILEELLALEENKK